MDEKKLLSRAEFAELAGCSPQAVTRAAREGRAYRDPTTGRYPATHPINLHYVNSNLSKRKSKLEDMEEAPETEGDGEEAITLAQLQRAKLSAEVQRTQAQADRYQLQLEKDKGNIIPIELMIIWLGYWGEAVRNNFLTLGRRIAGTDQALKDKIDTEVTRMIRRSRETVEQELKNESEELIKAMGGENEEKNQND
ncbi:MAG: hypothetical protein K9L57_07390 [Spirochaetaceae bacterium]|nr:hypothetical protein [Spirochaetaceae bacterium]